MIKQFSVLFFLIISSFSFSQDKDQNDFFLAESYYRKGEYEKATQLFKKLYDRSSFNTTYLKRLISSYQETDNFKEAEKLLKEKLKKSPSESYLYVFLGYNFDRQQMQEIAKVNYDKAVNSLEMKANYGGIIGRLFKDYNKLA